MCTHSHLDCHPGLDRPTNKRQRRNYSSTSRYNQTPFYNFLLQMSQLSILVFCYTYFGNSTKNYSSTPKWKSCQNLRAGGEGGVIWALRKGIFSGISFPYQSDHFRLNLHYFLKFNVLLFWQHWILALTGERKIKQWWWILWAPKVTSGNLEHYQRIKSCAWCLLSQWEVSTH